MKFAVIGLGSFGSALSRELATSGHEVIAVDTNENHIRDLREIVTMAAVADGTEPEALAQLGVAAVDVALITIGEGFEASLMITAHCQKLGVPRVYTRVINGVHEQLLDLMKVSGKIHVESLAAASFGRQITNEAVRRISGSMKTTPSSKSKCPGSWPERPSPRPIFANVTGSTTSRSAAAFGDGMGEEGYDLIGTPAPDFRLAKGDRLIVFGRLDDIGIFVAKGEGGRLRRSGPPMSAQPPFWIAAFLGEAGRPHSTGTVSSISSSSSRRRSGGGPRHRGRTHFPPPRRGQHRGEEGALHILRKNRLVVFEEGHRPRRLRDREGAAVADRRVEFGVMADRVAEADHVAEDGVRGRERAHPALPIPPPLRGEPRPAVHPRLTGSRRRTFSRESSGMLPQDPRAHLAVRQAHLDRDQETVELRAGRGKVPAR